MPDEAARGPRRARQGERPKLSALIRGRLHGKKETLWVLPVVRRIGSMTVTPAPGLRLNEHIEADGQTVFAHACKIGPEGIVSKRKTVLPLRPLARLDQEQEPGLRGGAARGGGESGAGVADALRSASIRRAGLNLALARFIYAWPTIHRCQFYCDASSKPGNTTISAPLELGPRNAQAKPRQFEPPMATGFGCDGCRVGTVVGIRSVRG